MKYYKIDDETREKLIRHLGCIGVIRMDAGGLIADFEDTGHVGWALERAFTKLRQESGENLEVFTVGSPEDRMSDLDLIGSMEAVCSVPLTIDEELKAIEKILTRRVLSRDDIARLKNPEPKEPKEPPRIDCTESRDLLEHFEYTEFLTCVDRAIYTYLRLSADPEDMVSLYSAADLQTISGFSAIGVIEALEKLIAVGAIERYYEEEEKQDETPREMWLVKTYFWR